LSFNRLNRLGAQELKDVLASLPTSINSLNLCNNALYILGVQGLKGLLASLPKGITSLDLSGNDLYKLGAQELKDVLASLPKGITSLDLSGNDLIIFSAKKLKDILASLPASITSLNLGSNQLGIISAKKPKNLLAGLPASVTSLDLSNNCLDKLDLASLAKVLATIPNHVTCVYLGNNRLFINKSAKEIDDFLQLLCGRGRSFNLSPGNGESGLARALAPMALLTQQNSTNNPRRPALPGDVGAHILSFLGSNYVPTPNNRIRFFSEQLTTTIKQVEKIQSSKSKSVNQEAPSSLSKN
jgi:hypothetical protein